jgi:phage baseplate assembly protein W
MSNYDASITNKSKKINQLFKDLDLDFGRNVVTNDVNRLEDVDSVKRSLRNLINTNYYERPFQPTLGCGVRNLLFEPLTPLTAVQLERKIEEVIKNYEPRVRVNEIVANPIYDENSYAVSIYFYVRGVNEPQQVTTMLERLR